MSIDWKRVPSSFKAYMLKGDFQKTGFKFKFPFRLTKVPAKFSIKPKTDKKINIDKVMLEAIASFHPDLSVKPGSRSKSIRMSKPKSIRGSRSRTRPNKSRSRSKY